MKQPGNGSFNFPFMDKREGYEEVPSQVPMELEHILFPENSLG